MLCEIFESREDCPEVEGFIWDHLVISFGDFEGVRRFKTGDLFILKAMIELRIKQDRILHEISKGEEND